MLNIGLDLLEQVGDIAKRAGEEILKIYETDFAVEEKADTSPVTEADKRAEELILRSISMGITDKYPIIGEEDFAAGNAPAIGDDPFWLVDPLDGTKEFVSRNGEFTVNIAIIDSGRPVMGVIHLPVTKTTYWGASAGAFAQDGDEDERVISCRQAPAGGLTAMVSRSHRGPDMESFLSHYPIAEETTSGSSLKFCRIAEGAADLYPRLGRTMEWDTAAGHAILSAAGGKITDLDGNPLLYGKPGFENPHFIAQGPGVAKKN
ncbi:MAG: 3'(2'),5'-bisphosphate nucleotidase CysQ [Rhodospirillales bacterium]|nr:3'(2'),5'-bisphosphate nucleotidase CysQ [Alphaproteobacteria bacterium]MBL6947500.1 3'(2'),5'-bisphosphate nucleotidase CysQ [Rhodospirillales bacterium]